MSAISRIFAIEPGVVAHQQGIVDIYNHYIAGSPATFDLKPFDLITRRPWFDRFGGDARHRLLVATHRELSTSAGTGQVLGYASSGPFHPKAAYETSVETSIYVREGWERHGIARALYARLLAEIAAAGAHRAYAGITQPNPASTTFHEKMGFRLAAKYNEVGFKFGRYWDVHWFEKDL